MFYTQLLCKDGLARATHWSGMPSARYALRSRSLVHIFRRTTMSVIGFNGARSGLGGLRARKGWVKVDGDPRQVLIRSVKTVPAFPRCGVGHTTPQCVPCHSAQAVPVELGHPSSSSAPRLGRPPPRTPPASHRSRFGSVPEYPPDTLQGFADDIRGVLSCGD